MLIKNKTTSERLRNERQYMMRTKAEAGVRRRTLTQYLAVVAAPVRVKVFHSADHPRSRFPRAPRKVPWPRNRPRSSCSSCALQGRPSPSTRSAAAAAPLFAHSYSGLFWSSIITSTGLSSLILGTEPKNRDGVLDKTSCGKFEDGFAGQHVNTLLWVQTSFRYR